MSPELSIVVPIYNSEKYLSRCIDSILQQDCSEIELLLVDDGSSDSSGCICDQYAARDCRVRVFHQSNAGVSTARNVGVEKAKGRFLAFVDSDDWMAPNIYSVMLPFAQKGMLPICQISNASSQTCSSPALPPRKYPVSQFFRFCENFMMNSPVNKIFSLEALQRYGIRFRHDLSLGEDLIFCLDYLPHCSGIVDVPDSCYFYNHDNTESLSQKYRKDFYYSQMCILERIRLSFEELHGDFAEDQGRYYAMALDLLLQSINHQYRRQCTLSEKEKLAFNQSIMDSKLFREALATVGEKVLRWDLRFLYRHASYATIHRYQRFLQWMKNKK